jgi:hypothetical protein
MPNSIHRAGALAALALCSFACEEPPKESPPAKPSATAAAAPAPAPTPEPPPKPVEKPSRPCPKDSAGDGTFDKPCMGKGKARMMEVSWNKKIGDKGPTFKIVNKSDLEIVWGRIVVWYYDKAGKLLPVKTGEKESEHAHCSGKIFAGAVKANEKIFMNFSCTKKEDVPEGAATIEAEVPFVGFTALTGDKPDTYWKNEDLVPEKRPKGGKK